MPQLTGQKRRLFRDHLELRLRRARGEQFQQLSARILGRLHGDNFVPQCPWGARGDLSCDGYLRTPPTIFACYGRENGDGERQPGGIVAKVERDLAGARRQWPAMEAWVFVSNIVDGVPAPVTAALERLHAAGPVAISYFGFDSFEHRILELDSDVVEDLVDEIAVREDFINLQPVAVQQIVRNVATAFTLAYLETPNAPVPSDKLELNRIPACQARQIKLGALGRETVLTCVERSVDPSLGVRLSEAFRARYAELQAQALTPGDIMDTLHDFALAGLDDRGTTAHAAAWAVLAYLFDICDIFEDKPWQDVA